MANVINKSNHLENQVKAEKMKVVLWGGAFFINFFILFWIIPAISMPLHLVFGYMINKNYKGYSKLKSGLEGEKSTLKILNGLGQEYSVVSDMEIEYEGKKSQIDSVIVGSNGVFVLETKNVKGYVVGKEQDHDITIHKVGRKGGEYSNSLYNPCKQVGTHVFRLSKVLQERGLNPWVQGMVFFSNPETEVQFQSSKTPVFNCANEGAYQVSSYISNFQGQPINTENQKKIIDILSQYILNK